MNLPETFRKIVSFLEENHYGYLIIGGIASAVLGEPRMTQDIDICIFLKKKEIRNFLEKTKEKGFVVREKGIFKRIKETGCFRISYGEFPIDFIIASTDFEKEALLRRQKIKVYGIDASFPTPEDLILFKIVPARYRDLADIESIVQRYTKSLDADYLEKWAQRLSNEAENLRIYKEIKRLLKLRE
jgi:predicted nucleotidyltransferase